MTEAARPTQSLPFSEQIQPKHFVDYIANTQVPCMPVRWQAEAVLELLGRALKHFAISRLPSAKHLGYLCPNKPEGFQGSGGAAQFTQSAREVGAGWRRVRWACPGPHLRPTLSSYSSLLLLLSFLLHLLLINQSPSLIFSVPEIRGPCCICREEN